MTDAVQIKALEAQWQMLGSQEKAYYKTKVTELDLTVTVAD